RRAVAAPLTAPVAQSMPMAAATGHHCRAASRTSQPARGKSQPATVSECYARRRGAELRSTDQGPRSWAIRWLARRAPDNAVGLELAERLELPSIVGDDPCDERCDDRADSDIGGDDESRVRAKVHSSGRLRRGGLQHL